MNATQYVEDVPQSIDKGKRRAQEPTESTPLLGSSSSTILDDPPPSVARRTLYSKLTAVFLGSLIFTVLACVALALLAWSYASRASHISTDDILNDGLVFQGPDRVDVLSITWSGGIWVRMEARMGFDAGSVIGVNASPDDGLLRNIWKAVGRWGVHTLDRVSVNMSTIDITSQSNPSVVLATIEPSPVVIPLTANPPSDWTWLTPISTPLLIRPTSNTSALFQFVREAWRDGSAAVKADVGSVEVRGGAFSDNSWRSLLHRELSNVRTALRIQIPPIPGIPHTGPVPSLSELITLKSFEIYSTSASIDLNACATLPDPAPATFNLTSPSLPFTILLPTTDEPVPIASVTTEPFTLTHPNITLSMSGTVLPFPGSASPLLSVFLTRYLSGRPNPILVATPLIPDLTVDLDFPAPNPRPHILRNVTIHDMTIKPHGSTFTASGDIYARIVLPAGMDIALHVGRVLPDVLVFDGEVPSGAIFPVLPPAPGKGRKPSPGSPFPDPLPKRAFARIRPDDWLPAQSGPAPSDPDAGDGAAFAVTAKIIDVPLEVLPGRQKEFGDFVSKVIFGSDGAVAGLLGVASVGVEVFGLPTPEGEAGRVMELSGLPFEGRVLVGKKGLRGLLGAVVGGSEGMSETIGRGVDEVKRLLDRYLRRGKQKPQLVRAATDEG
ncbi:hypothetical protein GGX14DRAFT_698363 [Mycena pura]|uniref:Uncharacterized protein n=1 Tax=Mycena pura TaxID=153505 RepID=A0AAD6VBH0_9AGAR|nr:hypothetical protein GGX14DRAFT_698363 [Mycena pura]